MSSSPVSISTLQTHFEYTMWATLKLLDATGRLTQEELNRDLQVSHRSVLETLQHIYYAERTWLARLEYRTQQHADPPPGPSLDDLKVEWPRLNARFKNFIEGCDEAKLLSDLHYRRLNGDQSVTQHWKVFMHVVNHATLHRGQVMAMLRQLGHTPPGTDILFFYLQQGH